MLTQLTARNAAAAPDIASICKSYRYDENGRVERRYLPYIVHMPYYGLHNNGNNKNNENMKKAKLKKKVAENS